MTLTTASFGAARGTACSLSISITGEASSRPSRLRCLMRRAAIAGALPGVLALSVLMSSPAAAETPPDAGSRAFVQGALLAPVAAAAQYGFAISIDGNFAVIGAPAQLPAGEAYVYERVAGQWTQRAHLVPAGGGADARFGATVSVSGDTVAVGAPLYDGVSINQGATFVYNRTGDTWAQQAILQATGSPANENFGWDVAVSGNSVAIGGYQSTAGGIANAGAVYVFTRNANIWTQQARLVAADAQFGARMGAAVAIEGDTLVAGARFAAPALAGQGAAYVFTRSGTAWSQQARLLASDAAANDQFGANVAVSGDSALVGTLLANAAYVFTRSGSAWSEQATLAVPGASSFGIAVDIDGEIAMVGAPSTGTGGMAYVFARDATTWTLRDTLAEAGGEAGDEFGRAVALHGGHALVGAPTSATPAGHAVAFRDLVSTDLIVDASNGFSQFTPGQAVGYEVYVINQGEGDANGATLRILMPPALRNVEWACAELQGATCPSATGTGDILHLLDLPAGATLRYDVYATIADDATGFVEFIATLTPPENVDDADPSNNTATHTAPVRGDGVFADGFEGVIAH